MGLILTFEQTEFQRLVDEIIALLERYHDNPSALEAALSELKDVYKKIPIYPGIIVMCLPKVVKPVKVDQLKEGNEVVARLKDGRIFSGKVANVAGDNFTITDCREFNPQRLCSDQVLSVSDLREVRLITRDILQKEWPDLNFEE